jgi:CheY-like chemotaxis protein
LRGQSKRVRHWEVCLASLDNRLREAALLTRRLRSTGNPCGSRAVLRHLEFQANEMVPAPGKRVGVHPVFRASVPWPHPDDGRVEPCRARKLVQRHKLATAALAVAMLSLVAGVASAAGLPRPDEKAYQSLVSYLETSLDRLSAADVDMVITDWNMPEMNGIEFIRALRGLDKMKETPILMVTTNAAKDDIVEALRAGVNNYIVKPFNAQTLKSKIDAVFSE